MLACMQVYLGTYCGRRVAVKSVWGWVEEDDEDKVRGTDYRFSDLNKVHASAGDLLRSLQITPLPVIVLGNLRNYRFSRFVS